MKKRVPAVLCFMLAAAVTTGLCQEKSRSASVLDLKGTVEIQSPKQNWIKARKGAVLSEGDVIRTRKKSWALLNVDGSGKTAVVEIRENSQMQLTELTEDKKTQSQTTLLDLALGSILIKAEKLHSEKSRFEVKTPTSIVGVRGTTFAVSVEAEE